MELTYVIVNAGKLGEVDFSKVIETSAETLRYSLDATMFVLKFSGTTPDFLEGITTYTHSEILTALHTPEWEGNDD